jgi:peptide-methionine (S)-S-oxide reductase
MKKYLFVFCILFFTSVAYAESQTIIVAGGCFWCVESDYEKHPGVLSAESGYINGSTKNPTYRQVASKKTGHYEVVKITYNPDKVSAKTLVDYFWRTIDPTDDKGQFCDKGSPYKTALFYQNAEQEKTFRQSLVDIEKSKPFDQAIVTKILPAETFYSAEDYHQDYYKKSSLRYKYYRASCGRDARIKKLWGEVASKQFH